MGRKKHDDSGGEGSWLNTYADMVTLLLTFFIVLFSMSSVQQDKFEELVRSFARPDGTADIVVIAISEDPVSAGVPGPMGSGTGEYTSGGGVPSTNSLPSDMESLYQYLKTYVEQNKMESAVSVSKDDQGIVLVRFSNDMLFEPDKYNLTTKSRVTLEFLGKGMKNMQDQLALVQISGHTADTQIADYPVDDWRLSGERAASVATYFEKVIKLDPTIMVTMGYGSSHPRASNDTIAGRKENRRVEITIAGKDSGLTVDSTLIGAYDSDRFPTDGKGMDVLFPSQAEASSAPAAEAPSSSAGASAAHSAASN